MDITDLPERFGIPFGEDADPSTIRPIPTASQIGIQAGAASLETGFPPDTMTPIDAGGTPPWGQDVNGLSFRITAWNRWQAAGGQVPYNSAFATECGGYPEGAILLSADPDRIFYFVNTIPDNTSDPDAGGAGWVFLENPVQPQGRLSLSANTPVITSNQTAKTLIYYTAMIGNLVPLVRLGKIFNWRFSADMELNLTAAALANTIVDVLIFWNAGDPVLVFTPAWTTATAGAGDRGTGGSTPQLTRLEGFLVNANAMTCRNGATTYSVGAQEGLYLGSLAIDATNGQVSCELTTVASPRWAVWNAYNRQTIIVSGTTGAVPFTGLAEEEVQSHYSTWVTLTYGSSQTSAASITQTLNGSNAGTVVEAGATITVDPTGGIGLSLKTPMSVDLVVAPSLGKNSIGLNPTVSGGGGSGFTSPVAQVTYRG